MPDPDSHQTLDPDDWEAMAALAHRMVDDAFEQLRTVRERPVWQPMPAEVEAALSTPAPRAPGGVEAAYDEFRRVVQPYGMGNVHPRFWGWYMGAGTVTGALADFLAAMMNPNVGGGNHSANLVEQQVVDWIREAVGLPQGASGLLVSGGSMANFVGLAVARHVRTGIDVRLDGLIGGPQLTIYASSETHSSVQKAVELLGIGRRHLRLIPVNPDFTIDLTALRATIADDRAAGLLPLCVVANAGTVNTGAIDDLQAIADLAAQEGLWFHVDGAIGGIAVLSDVVRPLLAGIERADSVSVDLHKWMHMPFEAGCVLVRDDAQHRDTFSVAPAYLAHQPRGLATGKWLSEYGLQLSRQFRALKVWMSVKEHGLDRFGEMISRNVDQAHHFAGLVAAHPRLEMMAPVGLDIVCFRYDPGELDGPALDALNEEILMQLHESGSAVPTYTTLGGRYCLRIAIANHRSRHDDFDFLAEEVVRRGDALAGSFTER